MLKSKQLKNLPFIRASVFGPVLFALWSFSPSKKVAILFFIP